MHCSPRIRGGTIQLRLARMARHAITETGDSDGVEQLGQVGDDVEVVAALGVFSAAAT